MTAITATHKAALFPKNGSQWVKRASTLSVLPARAAKNSTVLMGAAERAAKVAGAAGTEAGKFGELFWGGGCVQLGDLVCRRPRSNLGAIGFEAEAMRACADELEITALGRVHPVHGKPSCAWSGWCEGVEPPMNWGENIYGASCIPAPVPSAHTSASSLTGYGGRSAMRLSNLGEARRRVCEKRLGCCLLGWRRQKLARLARPLT